MKNISFYNAEKYNDSSYQVVEKNIFMKGNMYYISLSFIQEPEYGEGETPADISQYPLEDILDKYGVYVSDFYSEENNNSEQVCILEFASDEKANIEQLVTIVGRHVYNKEVENSGEVFISLEVE